MSDTGCLLGFPNRIDEGTLTGGSWTAALPLANIQTKLLGQVARSTNTAITSTTFNVALATERPTRVMSLTNNNMTLSGTVRFRATTEPTATNILLRSQEFDNATWGKNSITVAANSVVAPDGTTTADTLTKTAAGAQVVQSVTYAGGAVTASVFVKAATVSGYFGILIFPTNPNRIGAVFNLNTGVVEGTSALGTSTSQGATITAFPDGWYRCTLSATCTGAAGSLFFGPCEATLVYDNPFAGSVLANAYAWGTQLETGSIATSYYPTTTVATTRPVGYMDTWQSYAYDSGVTVAYDAVYDTTVLEWEDDNFWSGTYTAEEIAGYTSNYIHIMPTPIVARYFRIDVIDTGNSAGYIDIGRVFLGPAWQPERNMEIGADLGWASNTTQQRALSGTKYFQRRTPYRVTNFTLKVMSEDEAMGRAFELDKMAGIDQEILWVHSVTDTIHAVRRRYLARLRELSPIEFPQANILSKGYALEEVL